MLSGEQVALFDLHVAELVRVEDLAALLTFHVLRVFVGVASDHANLRMFARRIHEVFGRWKQTQWLDCPW